MTLIKNFVLWGSACQLSVQMIFNLISCPGSLLLTCRHMLLHALLYFLYLSPSVLVSLGLADPISHYPHYSSLPQSYLHLALWSFLPVWILMLIITTSGSLDSLYCSASHVCNAMKSSVVLLNGSCSLLLLPYRATLLRLHGRPCHLLVAEYFSHQSMLVSLEPSI